MAFYRKCLTVLAIVELLIFHGIVIWAAYTGLQHPYLLWAQASVVLAWLFLAIALLADRLDACVASVVKS